MKPKALFFALSALPLVAGADQPESLQLAQNSMMDVIQIIGTQQDARELSGSGALVDQEQLRIEAATDINQILKTVPGTYIREEDGFGLRPNIGIRAASSERSSKVTLLEDGIMIAPAPYSNPAAYYFPTALRMNSVEILKGASLLRYGPQTTGGVINMVSTPIPETAGGSVMVQTGEYNSRDIHANYGGKLGNLGFLVETAQRDSDGFKSIDGSNRDAGFDIQDYLVKLGWESNGHSVLFKGQYSEEKSNETYLGLTDADFKQDPNRRYGLSSIDQMDNDHRGFSLTYRGELTDQLTLSTVLYHNEFSRNWFKLSGGGGYIEDANSGDTTAQGILDGSLDVAGLNYKNNNRSYESTGIEVNLGITLSDHQLAVGLRDHHDEMDRFQPVEIYNQVNGSLVYQYRVEPTGGDNRLEEADAVSFWVTDHWQATDRLQLDLALRYEDVSTEREQFDDVARTTPNPGAAKSNDSEEWLPGVALTFDLNSQWQLLGGVHKGFSPLGGGAADNEEPETSINYEFGTRYMRNDLFVEAIAFYSDFDNKTENCSNANPCSNSATSGSFTTGEAIVEGVEIKVGQLLTAGDFQIPVDLAYTRTWAEVAKDNPAEGFEKGDKLADVPENVLSLRAGLEHGSGWNNYAVVKYIDELCVNIGCGAYGTNDATPGKTDDLLVVDFVSRYDLSDDAEVFVKVENLFDEQEIVSRVPDGARPNKPRTASVGLQLQF